MLFESLTAQAGWLPGLLLLLLLVAGLLVAGALSPIPAEGDTEPPGWNPAAWRELSLLATGQTSPWSAALPMAQRLPFLAGASVAGMSLISLLWLGYSWRQRLEGEVDALRGARQVAVDASAETQRRLDAALGENRRLEGLLEVERRRGDAQAQSQQQTLAQSQARADRAEAENRQLQQKLQDQELGRRETTSLVNDYLRDIARSVREQCATCEIPPRPQGLEPDPRDPRPPAGLRPPLPAPPRR